MAWLRIDDGFPEHPKVAALTDGELRVWLRVLCYCAAHRDPTVIEKETPIVGLGPYRLSRFHELELLDYQGTYQVVKQGRYYPRKHYLVHDWLQYQPKDATNAERQARWRARRAQREAAKNADKPQTAVSNDVTPRYDDRYAAVTETVDSRAGTRGTRPVPVDLEPPPSHRDLDHPPPASRQEGGQETSSNGDLETIGEWASRLEETAP